MTLEEFAYLSDAIKTYYPKDNMLPTKESMSLWYDALKDIDYRSAEQGLRKYVMSNKFPPSISDIRECSLDFERPQELNEMEAWTLVRKAISHASCADEEFAKLPPIVQRAVGSPSQIWSWGMDEDFNESVVSSNFMRVYKAELIRAQEISKLPEGMQAAIKKVNENRDIEVKPYIAIEDKLVEHKGLQMSDRNMGKFKKLIASLKSNIPVALRNDR